MATPKLIPALVGSWAGTSRLNMGSHDPNPIRESASTLTVGSGVNYGMITYSWVEEGHQEGAMIITGSAESDAMEIAWVDSWHQSSSVLLLRGTGLNADKLAAKGEYGPYDGQMWGWRIELSNPNENEFLLMMYNVAPDGNEEWAVECLYTRAT